MNPHFRFGFFNRRTLLAVSRAIAPVEVGIEHLDQFVVDQIELQVRCFPPLHRFGFCLGLWFIEFGAVIGAWGLLPFSFLKRDRATKRLYRLLHSRFTPVRLLTNGLRVLVCLSAYGHSEVERWFGFERRAWRNQRIATREALLQAQAEGLLRQQAHVPVPEPLYTLQDHQNLAILSWEAHQHLLNSDDATELELEAIDSPFDLEDYIEVKEQ